MESGFYDAYGPDGERLTLAEETLALVQHEARAILDCLDHPPLDWSEPDFEQRANFALFLALQLTRTREAWDAMIETEDLLFRATLDLNFDAAKPSRSIAYLESMYGRPVTAKEFQSAQLLADHIEQFKMVPPPAFLITQMFRTAMEIAPMLANRNWTILHSDGRAFVTTDRPVTLWRDRTPDNDHYGVGAITAERIYFPLDCRRVLMIHGDIEGEWSQETMQRAEARRINRILAHWSHRFIFHSPKHRPLEGESISPHGPVLHINGIPVRPGVNVWNTLRNRFREGTTVPAIHFGSNVDRSPKRSK